MAQAQSHNSRELVDHLARTPLSQIVILAAILTVLRAALFPYLIKTPRHLRTPLFAAAAFGNEMFDAVIYAAVVVFMIIRPFGVQAFLIPSGSMWPELQVNDFIVANKMVYRYTDPQRGDVVVFHPPKDAALSPDDLDASGDMKFDFVKRCIGIPGDVIEMKKGVLYRNGQVVQEPYIRYSDCVDPDAGCTQYRRLGEDEVKQITLPNFKLVNYKGRLIPLYYTDLDANAPEAQRTTFSETRPPYKTADIYEIPNPADETKAAALPAQPIPPGMYLMMGDNRNNSYDGRSWGLISRDRVVGRGEFVWWPLSQMQRLH